MSDQSLFSHFMEGFNRYSQKEQPSVPLISVVTVALASYGLYKLINNEPAPRAVLPARTDSELLDLLDLLEKK